MSLPAPLPGLLDIAAYKTGDSHLAGITKVIKLSSNESALGPSPKAIAAFQAAGQSLHRYPDGACTALRTAIGHRYGLDPERIVCGTGSDDLIALLIKTFCARGDTIVQSQHGFLMYAIYAKGFGVEAIHAPEKNLTTDVDAMLAAVTDTTRLVFLTTPNNPTGTYLPADEVKRLRAGLREDILLVIDAAYAEFVDRNDYDDGTSLATTTGNTVVLRTFSKIHGLGGARVGWCYGPLAIIDAINRVRSPFGIPGSSQAAATAAIADVEYMTLAKAHNDYWLAWLKQEIAALGLSVTDSVANFVLVRFADTTTAKAADAFLRSKGIIVRNVASYALPEYLRITVGRDDENHAVIDTLRDFLAEHSA